MSGAMEVMRKLLFLCPMDSNGTRRQMAIHGDQKSVELMIQAQRNLVRARGPEEDLLAYVPSPQEFHKSGIVFQDIMNR